MNIEVTENILVGSIVYQLSQFFGEDYTYYTEELEQGFKRPAFHVSRVDNTSRKGYTGHQYKLRDDDYRFVIKYFTDVKDKEKEDINNKIDDLKKLFDYLYIVNFNEEKVYSKANRINSISVTVQEDVLFFEMVIPIRTVMYLDIDKVKDNYLTENIK